MFNLHSIMTRAWELYHQNSENRFCECLRQAWDEAKNPNEKRYNFNLAFAKEYIMMYLDKLVNAIENIHDQHKYDILCAALVKPMTADGVASMSGKMVCLCKYALRNA